MAKLIGYTVANGGSAVDFDFDATVHDQEEIEVIRRELMKELSPEYNVWFKIRKPQGSKLEC